MTRAQVSFTFVGAPDRVITAEATTALDVTLHAAMRNQRSVALCRSAARVLMPRTCDPWRLELRAKETGRIPCAKCCALRRHVDRMVAMPADALELLKEVQAYVALAPLELDLEKPEAKVALVLAPALELLITQRPVAMVWVGKTGASCRWTPKTTERSHGPWVEVCTERLRRRMSAKELFKMFKPPSVAEVKRTEAAHAAGFAQPWMKPWVKPW